MILAIDPDVFYASRCDAGLKCKITLLDLLDRHGHWRLAVDDDEIEREYLDYLQSHLEEKDDPAISILEPVLQGNQERRIPVPNARTAYDEEKLVGLGCTTKVEPELLGMVSNARGLGMKLLLAGDLAACPGLRHRGLNTASIRHKLKNHWPWLDVRFASEPLIISAPFTDTPPAEALDRIFELLVPQALQNYFPTLRCFPTPGEVGVQIDAYGYMEERGTRVVLVGESKHRREGNEGNNISRREVGQLLSKITAASNYEKHAVDKSVALRLQIMGVIVSNAQGIDDDARDLACENGIKVIRACVPKRRSRRVDWSIYRLECILE
jgi:hypothetical protein